MRPQQPWTSSGRLIVVEHGAGALDVFLSVGGPDETTVVAQSADEASDELFLRFKGRISVIERAGKTVDRATVVIATKRDAQSQAARERTTRTLVEYMGSSGSGELVLAAHGAEAQHRDELMTLVETLLAARDASSVTIRLEFQGRGSASRGDKAPGPN